MHSICYELEILRKKIFAAILQPAKSAKFFYLENFRLYGIFFVLLSMADLSQAQTCTRGPSQLINLEP